jgi:hypothetical protein
MIGPARRYDQNDQNDQIGHPDRWARDFVVLVVYVVMPMLSDEYVKILAHIHALWVQNQVSDGRPTFPVSLWST